MSKAKRLLMKNNSWGELYTPPEAVEMIVPYIPDTIQTIWECTAIKESKIVRVLEESNFNVIGSHIQDGYDFFEYEPEQYDMIITNPPYQYKNEFLERAFELNKPFMFLLPLTTLEGKKRGQLFSKHHLQVLIPNKRFNFLDKKSGAWFQTSWFCYKCNLKNDLNFINIL